MDGFEQGGPELNTYEVLRYPTAPQPNTLPAAFGVLAHLRGRNIAPFSRSRVLEIGCGDGGNLLSLAMLAPESEFVGFDLAHSPIADAQAMAAAAGLTNVRFNVGDIGDPHVVDGEFDYIIAHGIYAWVPAQVRQAMMALLSRALAPEGLAFISYNVAPGCIIRQGIRTVLQDQVGGIAEPKEKLEATREPLQFFAEGWEEGGGFYPKVLAEEARHMLERDPAVLFHDELGGWFEPQMLSDVVAAARGQVLEYLCDAQPPLNHEAFFPSVASPSIRERSGNDWVRYEQMKDFLTLRLFRQSLICRPSSVEPAITDWTGLLPLHAEGRFVRKESESGAAAFETRDGTPIETDDAAFAGIIQRIADAFPGSLPLADVVDGPLIGNAILQLYLLGVLGLRTEPIELARHPGPRPLANKLARAQAARGAAAVATMRHISMRLPDEGSRQFLTLLDGTKTRAELTAAMAMYLNADVEATRQWIPGALDELARHAVMAG